MSRHRPDRPLLALLLLAAPLAAQQVPDTTFRPPITHPAHPAGTGPVISIDEGHHNFHRADGRYAPFAALLRRDGYRVVTNQAALSAGALAGRDLLVVANALAGETEDSRTQPAFAEVEVAAVLTWVREGGALLLIADHMPFGAAAASLGRAFGFELADGFAFAPALQPLPAFTRVEGTLRAHPITDGRRPGERVERVLSFMGQAFRAPATAEPLLVLPPESVQLFPDTAWVFSAATRRADAGGWLQGAVLRVGRGRVAVFGEAAMFTAQVAGPNRVPSGMNAPGAEQNASFLRNLVRWLTERA